jgi:DNA repair exonuclease SbcCD ATPase subunit
MTTLEDIEIKNFFSVSHAKLCFENQGLVVIHGRVGSGKTAISCESVLYGLYGSSFEYGSNPGQSIKKNTEKEFSVSITLRSESGRFRIRRGKESALKLNGLELHRIGEDGVEDRLTRGTVRDTQKLITEGLLKMSERLFRRSVVCSTDMSKFPDTSDSEKKSILDELLEMWVVQGAHEETLSALKSIKYEFDILNREYQIAESRLSEEESFSIPDLVSLRQSLRTTKSKISSQTDELGQLEEILENKSALLHKSLEKAREDMKNMSSQSVSDKMSEVKAEIREITKKRRLMGQGKCQECGQPTDSLCSHDLLDDKEKQLVEVLDKLIDQKNEIDQRKNEAHEGIDKILKKEKKLLSDYSSLKGEIEDEINSLHRIGARIESDLIRAEEAEDRVKKARDNKEKIQEKLGVIKARIANEEVLEESFSNKGFRLSILRSVIPFMNEESERVTEMLNTPIRVKFAIRGSEESFSGNLSIEVHNPIGAWQYHGSSAGERRTIDIVILMCLLSLANKRNNRFNHMFFDETFEKLDPPLQRAVLSLLKEMAKTKSSVFLITHSANEIKQDVDQTWEVNRGGVLTISKS